FAELLVNPKYGRFKKSNVTLLNDAEATTNRIKLEIERLSEAAKPEDLVVLYISTHGSPRDLTTLDVNYIVTYDTNPSRLYATSLPMVTVVKDASKLIRAQRMAIFLDTCFSGAATLAGVSLGGASAPSSSSSDNAKGAAEGGKGINFPATVSTKMLSQASEGGQGRVIITASQSNESSWESHELKNGIFTYYLIQALKQNNGLMPIGEVFIALRDQVSQRVSAEKNQIQRPMMEPPDTKLDIRIGVQPQSN
ncbi:MAG TPA: caspase family protein, partial [Blastocatellia bacterium]|nr:caspase family protein [Blastocatellia bacterium]